MTKVYENGEKFPSSTFCVFSNRIVAVFVAAMMVMYKHGELRLAAPLIAFAPPSMSNTLSSWGQYEALNYVSFPLQTLSKSTKVIPVMLMGKVLNAKEYPWVEYVEALAISAGVSLFALTKESKGKVGDSTETAWLGVLMLTMYIVSDSFTSQYQARVYKEYPTVDQFQMMFASNVWAITFTLSALLLSGELWTTLAFLHANPSAIWDNVIIAITSATGQLFIFYTIKMFGPIVFTIMMTTRQMFSMVLSTVLFSHPLGEGAVLGAVVVFITLILRIKRQWNKKTQDKKTPEPATAQKA